MKFWKFNNEITEEDIKKFHLENQKIGVIIHIEDNLGNILLQRRGLKSRDECLLYEDVGGKVESGDFNYKEAIFREMREEMGDNVKIELWNSNDIFHCYKNNINWIFIVFRGIYIDGEIKIMEPKKCLGYNFFTYEEAINSNVVSESCKYLTKNIRKYY